MELLGKWVVRHRVLVGLVWLAITVVGVLLAPSVSGRLQSGVNLDSAAYTANQQIAKQYGGATANPGVVVINLPNGTTVRTAEIQARLQSLDAGITKAMPQIREISYASTGNQALVGNGGSSTILLVYPPKSGGDIPTAVLDQLTRLDHAPCLSNTADMAVLSAAAGLSRCRQAAERARRWLSQVGWNRHAGLAMLRLDIKFHDAVYAAAGHRREQAWQRFSQVHQFLLTRIAISNAGYLGHFPSKHRALVRALRSCDGATAAELFAEHRRHAFAVLMEQE
jgi:hypothetical protein